MRSIKTVLAIIGITLLLMRPAARAQDEDWHDKGRRLLGQKQYDEAIEAFSTAIDIIPNDYQSYNYRGVAWALKQNLERAIADYSKAIEIRPRYAAAFNNRGFARTQTGDLKAAIDDYTRALEINPFFIDAYNSKAWILATSSDQRIRDGAQALELATKAVELKPDISSMDTLAAAHAAAGNFKKAVDLQTKAIQQLMQENKTAEVAKYMKHLRSYRSQQALLIDYSGGTRTAATRSAPKASLKAGPKGAAVTPDGKVKITSATHPPKRAAAKPSVQTAAKQAKPAPSVTSQETVATAKTPKPAAAVKPLPYTIQVSSFRDPQKSTQVARKLNTGGDPAFTSPVNITGKGKWYRVYIGNYGTLTEAKDVAEDLKRRKFRYVNVTRTPYTVQVGEPIPKSKAGELHTRLQAKGFFSYSLPVKTDPSRIRVLVGAFESKPAAADLSTQLKQDGFNPKITLR